MADTPTAVTPITPTDMARALGVFEQTQSGEAWFGVLDPLAPIAPPQVAGRQQDYQFGYNRLIQPKQGDRAGVTMAQLRDLSESWDVLRSVIETRKDKGTNIPLVFRDRDWKPGKTESAQVVAARKLFRKPDGYHTLTAWRRMIREDLYVIDAPTVYIEGAGGKVRSFDIIDGATIKPLADDFGRIGKGFQQILKGVQAVNYSGDQIIYSPRNPRPHKFYGFSPVEQAVITIETGLRRAVGQLNHFTDGNIPEMFIACPETWQPAQVKEMQQYWDAVMSGNLKARAGARFIPGGVEPHQYKGDAILKNEFDEWITRIICYFFSVSPQPFIREMNRATAEEATKSANLDGVLSELTWEKDLFDEMLSRAGFDNVEAIHDTNVEPDPKTRSDMVMSWLAGGLIKPEYAIEKLGLPAEAMAEKKEDPAQPSGNPSVKPEAEPKKADCAHDHSHAHKADDLPPMDSEAAMIAAVQKALDEMATRADDIAQAAFSGSKVPDLIFSKSGVNAFVKSARAELGAAAIIGEGEAQKLVGKSMDIALLEAPAKAWAADRAAWLVGMKWDGKKLIENPDATYRITDESRAAIRSTVTKAFEERWTPAQLSEQITAHEAFSPRRALMIARTEIAEAQEVGSMTYYKAAGVPKKKWSAAFQCCPLCEANAAQGAIPLDSAFQSGHQHGPAHPNDRCRVLPVMEDTNV